MRKKDILMIPPKKPEKEGQVITAQAAGKVLILDCYEKGGYAGRYCMETGTFRYQSWEAGSGKWTQQKLMRMFGYEPGGYYSIYDPDYYKFHEEVSFDSEADEETVRGMLGDPGGKRSGLTLIEESEQKYNEEKRDRSVDHAAMRMARQMKKVPPMPEDIQEWTHQVMGGEDYMFRAEGGKGKWQCTNCCSSFPPAAASFTPGYGEKELEEVNGTDIQDDSLIICPACKKQVRIKKRKRVIRKESHIILLQNMDEEDSVARYIDVRITWDNQGRHIILSEGIRIVIYRKFRKYPCEIYYSQTKKSEWAWGPHVKADFDRTNWMNRKTAKGYLYPVIHDALKGTVYEVWERVFGKAAEDGVCMNYNLAMRFRHNGEFIHLCEYLAKGRFRRLLAESIDRLSKYGTGYQGNLDRTGKTIEEVFGIRDRQKINRIRDMDGGEVMLAWMRYSEISGKKVGKEFLEWTEEHRFCPDDLKAEETQMSPEQIMNYIRRQRAESYPGKEDREVLEQWKDYLNMCSTLGKNLRDTLVSRPRELKRRHDEAVEEIRKRKAVEEQKRSRKAAERMERDMREKFPGAEENLEEVRELLEYGDETYQIVVPKRLAEISSEGYALHHCAGSSERYFERIMRHETYICFLRRTKEPDIPYYTIEVEPGGTIRQHRSYCDEEPGIEEIRGFLKKWQKVIRIRMKEEDYRREAVSRRLREDNIRELEEKQNTRVLKGLMEDFMEAT